MFINSNLNYSKQKYGTPKPELYGIYNVESFVINKDTLPPLLTDTIRWKKLISDSNNPKYLIVKGMDDKNRWYTYKIDSLKTNLTMTHYKDSTDVYNLDFIKKDSTLIFKGTWKNDSIKIKMNQLDLTKIRLMNTGFNWINEYPNNR